MSANEATLVRGGAARLLWSELKLTAARRRNVVGLAVLCAIPVIMAIVIKSAEPTGDSGPPFFSALLGNGLLVVLTSLSVELTMFLPMAMAILAGDAVAGEANQGTLRYLLAVPVGRTRLLAVKFGALCVSAAVGVAAVATTAGVVGVALFGAGDLISVSGSALSFAESLGRVAQIVLYTIVCMIAMCAVGLFLSTLTEQPIGAAAGGFMWVVADQVLGSISALDWLHPFLLTTYWHQWTDLLRDPAEYGGIATGLTSALAYTAIFGTAAWARFTTKDITG